MSGFWSGVPQLMGKASMDAYDEDDTPYACGVSSEFVCILDILVGSA